MKVFSVESNIPTLSKGHDATIIVDVASAGNNQGSATEIPRSSRITVARATLVNPGEGIRLPSNADIGDIVEIYADPAILLYPPTGETFHTGTSSFAVQELRARKISATIWAWT